ncbi:MAG: DUF1345 domain-containing protein [Pseudomonadota bacterium]
MTGAESEASQGLARDWLWLAIVLGACAGVVAALGTHLAATDALLVGFDVGCVTYLVLTGRRALGLDAATLKRRIDTLDEGRRPWVAMGIGLLVTVVVIVALVVELQGKEAPSAWAIGLAASSLLLAWLFFNVLFALHYADLYYSDGGLSFPKDQAPDTRDFLYFSFTIGMTFQVSDVAVTSQGFRRRVLVHGLLAFLFNVIIVALSVNMAA